MVLNRVLLAAVGVMALAWSGLSVAQQYRADEYLKLDLSRAVLSPKPLGPVEGFTPGPLGVAIDRGTDTTHSNAELLVDPKAVPTVTVNAENAPAPKTGPKTALETALKAATPHMRVAHARVERVTPRKPHALVALHGRNPTEAQARDISVQVWPCRTGGICNWKR